MILLQELIDDNYFQFKPILYIVNIIIIPNTNLHLMRNSICLYDTTKQDARDEGVPSVLLFGQSQYNDFLNLDITFRMASTINT